jgi:hypothetical protein
MLIMITLVIYMCVLMVNNKIIWFNRNMENHT